jgi:hypothetical protein
MGRIDARGPELPTEAGPPALDDPDAMARLRATFVDGTDGWVDDTLASPDRGVSNQPTSRCRSASGEGPRTPMSPPTTPTGCSHT